MPKRGIAALLGANIAILAALCVGFAVLARRVDSLSEKTRESLDEVRLGLFHDAVARVVAGARGEREECIRVAEWLAGSLRSGLGDKGAYKDVGWWHARLGQCGARARLMTLALRRLGIEAGIWNLYDYGFGHSCVQAFYDGRWHFFDPTYGGYFVGKDGHVLSWDEIVADPKAAVASMRVFKGTLDRSASRGPRIRNEQRMRSTYRVEALARATKAGFRRSRVFTLPVRLQLPPGTDGGLLLGRNDGSKQDLRRESVCSGTRCYYLDSLGARRDNFRHEFRLGGVETGNRVLLRFAFSGDHQGRRALTATSETGRIVQGAIGPRCEDTDAGDTWTILYEAGEGIRHAVLIGLDTYADKERSYAGLDAIEARRVGRRSSSPSRRAGRRDASPLRAGPRGRPT